MTLEVGNLIEIHGSATLGYLSELRQFWKISLNFHYQCVI